VKYYVDIDEKLAEKLKQVADDDIIEVLTKLAEKETSSDELSAYDDVKEIRSDESLTPAERKRKEILWQRRQGGR
jgi:Mn-dependent DtxR family transcriptional regulator